MDRKLALERLNLMKYNLKTYRDSWFEDSDHGRSRPCIVWKKYDLGMGWASHASGDPGGFKQLGFKDYVDFYRLPMERRNEFLQEGLRIFVKTFGNNKIKGTGEELDAKYKYLKKELEVLAKKYHKFKRKTCSDTKEMGELPREFERKKENKFEKKEKQGPKSWKIVKCVVCKKSYKKSPKEFKGLKECRKCCLKELDNLKI